MKLNKRSAIGIIGAMQSEVDLLSGLLEDKKETRVGRHTFLTGSIAGRRVVLSRAGVGKVNAAACAAAMILKFHPAAIVNTGVAGALDPALSVGDLAVADAAVEYDLDYGVLGDPRGTIWYPDGTDEKYLPTDPALADALEAAARKLGFSPLRGVIASGDRFVSDPAVKRDIRASFGDAVRVCEMEGAAIVHVCRLYGVRCGILRSVSDSADGNAEVDFPTFAARSARAAATVIEQLISDL